MGYWECVDRERQAVATARWRRRVAAWLRWLKAG